MRDERVLEDDAGGGIALCATGADDDEARRFCALDAFAASMPAWPVQYERCTVEWQHA